MTIWTLLVGICLVVPIMSGMDAARTAGAGIGGYLVALIVGSSIAFSFATVMPHFHTWISKRLSVASGKLITVTAVFTIFAVESMWILLAAVASWSTTLTVLSSLPH